MASTVQRMCIAALEDRLLDPSDAFVRVVHCGAG
jgi:hypothetical protein